MRILLATLALWSGSLFFAAACPAAGADAPTALSRTAHPLVMLDPGHGGAERGARAGVTDEAALNLDLAQRVAAVLLTAGARVAYTREADLALSATARTLLANQARPACLLSLHHNSSPTPSSRGFRVFVPPPGGQARTVSTADGQSLSVLPWGQAQAVAGERSRQLGLAVAEQLEAPGTVRRGVQSLRLALFRGLAVPAAEVEVGFLSSPEELKKLTDDKERQALAERLARGVLNWLKARGEL